MKWVKATDRLPLLTSPLPIDTEDERGIVFINRTHSAATFWYPSYGRTAENFIREWNGWPIEQWEWLDES